MTAAYCYYIHTQLIVSQHIITRVQIPAARRITGTPSMNAGGTPAPGADLRTTYTTEYRTDGRSYLFRNSVTARRATMS